MANQKIAFFIFLNPLKFLKAVCAAFQVLSLYGAFGIVCFGLFLSLLLHFHCRHYAPLWFCAAVFIYNLDRLKADPSDALNTPLRSGVATQLRYISITAAVCSAIFLILLPLLDRNWLLLLLVTGGGLFCANYSIALFGFRFKALPLLKTLFAPGIVTVAILAPPLLDQHLPAHPLQYFTVTVWAFCMLLFNMVLCDLRDIAGDSAMGIKTLPVLLGARGTIRALIVHLAIFAALSAAVVILSPPRETAIWLSVVIGSTLYLAALLFAVKNLKPRPESFYEWWVEGILFVPLLFYWVAR